MIRLVHPSFSEQVIEKVVGVLRSGNLVQGKYVNLFERALEEYLGIENAVVVSSGTAALHLSMLAIGVGPGDEVIMPAFSFPATANAVEITGAQPVFVDINLDDYCINVSEINKVISNRTKAIIPVHEFGQAADMGPLLKIAKKHNLVVVEDAACALGSEYSGKKVGTFGLAGCFSFHPRKILTTGEGGAVVTRHHYIAEKVRSLRNHGMTTNNRKVDFTFTGLNYRMTDFQAALGMFQMGNLDNSINHRIQIANIYNQEFNEVNWLKIPFVKKNTKMAYQTYHLLINNKKNRDMIIQNLKVNGIESNLGAFALHLVESFKIKYKYSSAEFRNAKQAFLNGLSLPLGEHVNSNTAKRISELIVNTVKIS